MEVIAAATIWSLFAAFLIFPLCGLPRILRRTAMALLVAELAALAVWHYGSLQCVERPCAPLAETGRTAASLDVPLLALALVALAILSGIRARSA